MPDYNGFNTQKTRDSGQSLKPKSKVVFTLLLDHTASDASTLLTAMAEEARITHEAGQSDQQLCRVVLDLSWTYETRFTHFVSRIGGMYWVMSFSGYIDVQMKKKSFTFMLEKCFWWSREDAYREKVLH